MPEILVLRQPEDKIYDRIDCKDDNVGETVQEVYDKLNPNYSIEVKYD